MDVIKMGIYVKPHKFKNVKSMMVSMYRIYDDKMLTTDMKRA